MKFDNTVFFIYQHAKSIYEVGKHTFDIISLVLPT
jgi:hypothetical protein